MRTRHAVALVLVAACGPAGCGADASRPHAAARDALGAARRDSAGVRILELPRTLAEVAAGGVHASVVGPDLRIGESNDAWFGAPTDVASLGAGRFAVFDRMERTILLFDSAGAPAGRLGREGGAPGEYREPLALAAVGGHLVAWQDRPSSTFTDAENYLSFAEQAPTITAAFGAGACLFLAGFAPPDWVDGTSLTWVAVNVESAEVEAVFRLAPPVLTLEGRHLRVERHGGVVSEVDGRFAFVIARNDDGAFVVQRYPLPPLRCAA